MKICAKCGISKGVGEFGIRRVERDGLNKMCRPCRNAKQSAWCRANPDKVRAIKDRWLSVGNRRQEQSIKAGLWHKANRQRAYDQKRKRTYGLSVGQYNAMLSAQGHKCAIGGHPFGKKICVDHDHVTGAVRGLLCWEHNVAIGKLGDNVEGLLLAVAYLRSAGLAQGMAQDIVAQRDQEELAKKADNGAKIEAREKKGGR